MDGPADSGPMTPRRPPMERAFRMGPHGRWWNNPEIAQKVGLSADQQKKMDDIFQQHRLKLVDLHANLEKQQILIRPLIEADNPNESQVLAQIDKIAQARAELEKADAHMLFDIRKVLTADQWQKLKVLHQQHREEMMRRGERGERGWRDHGRGPGPGGPGPDGSGGSGPGNPPPAGPDTTRPPQ